MPQYCLQPLWGGAAEIAQVDLVVLAAVFQVGFL